MMVNLRFALRLFSRDWRSGELRLLAVALIVAVAAVTAVGFFTDRIERAIALQASEILAADLVLTGNNPIPPRFAEFAAEQGLETASTLSFPSMVMQNDRVQLVEVKAVGPEYPLRGELRVRSSADAPETPIGRTPLPGSLWIEPRLLALLGMQPNEKLSLGEKTFDIEYILSRDTAEGPYLFQLGPRVLMSLDDIPATGLVTAASRVRHSLLIAGTPEQVESYRAWADKRLPKGVRLRHMSNAGGQLSNALDRASRFLGLAALAAVLIAGCAVALSTRRFVERQSDTSAILRCLGATRRVVIQALLVRMVLLGTVASLAGAAVGYLAQFALAELMAGWFTLKLPLPGAAPLGVALGTGLVTLLGFTLPPILRLGDTAPLRVLRRDLATPPPSYWVLALSALAALAVLMLWQAADLRLALMFMGGALFTGALLYFSSRLLVHLLSGVRRRSGAIWRYGLATLARNPRLTSIQLAGFGLGIMALLLLAIVRVDLLSAWERTIPEKAPNQFLVNIQPQDSERLGRFLSERGIEQAGIYPMLRGRLTRINGIEVSPDDYTEDRAQRLVAREFNLSWAARLQSDNRVVEGRWWTAAQLDEPLFSVEKGLAESLRIDMGDELKFNLAGREISGRVASLRSVKWDSFHPNFFVIGTPGLLREHPATYITSFYLDPRQNELLPELVALFPSVTIIDVSSLMNQVREIIARGSAAVEYVFLFTLAAGLLVLYAGIQTSREHRRQESAILRTLGLTRQKLLLAVGVEFLVLGALAGLLASSCAGLIGWLVSFELFELDYRFNPWLWFAGIAGGGIGIGIAGVAATYPLVIQPPLQTLRER